MKRVIFALLLAVLLLAGCVQKNGITVNTISKTISDGNYTYEYTDETVGDSRTITIVYPDGNTYTWTQTNKGVEDQYSGLFQVDKYKSGETLVDAIVNPGAEQQKPEQEKVINGVTYVLDEKAQTIAVNGHVLRYTYEDGGTQIIYPNGAEYCSTDGNWVWRNAPSDMVMNNGMPYADCYDVCILVPKPEQEKDYGPLVGAILIDMAFIGLGIWVASRPYDHWNWRYGWRYKDAQPSDEALGRIAALGICQIVMGVIVIIVGFFL